MKTFLLLFFTASVVLGQQPFNAVNLRLTGPPAQGTAASVAKVFTLNGTTGIGETITTEVLWEALVLTGDIDTTDISGFSTLGRNLVDDVTTSDMQGTLGGTTVGKAYFTLTNPGAVTFPRQNADNSVTSRSAADLKTDLSLNNVDNTSDAGKPVSTAQQTALNLKLNAATPTYSGVMATNAAAPTIASATTIAPTTSILFVSGNAQIDTITAPSPISAGGGQITIIPTGAFTTGTGGNIALACTAVVSKALIMTYDQGTAKWYPSYQ